MDQDYRNKFGLELSKEIIRMLDAQQEYFKTRSQTQLTICKNLERSLRNKAQMGTRVFEDKIGPRFK